ncbi:hypothetical protein LguiB_033393 [Lonicera macranthoides]
MSSTSLASLACRRPNRYLQHGTTSESRGNYPRFPLVRGLLGLQHGAEADNILLGLEPGRYMPLATAQVLLPRFSISDTIHDLTTMVFIVKLNLLDVHFEDFLAFSAVCSSWRLVYLKKNWNPSATSPWLILDVNHNSEALIRCNLSLCRSKAFKLRLPEANSRCWGSSSGWVVSIDNDLVIGLLNPITHVFIVLPPLYALENQIHTKIDWFSVIYKANVLRIKDGFLTVVTLGMHHNLYFARAGDSAWTIVQLSYPNISVSVMCFKDQIYAASAYGALLLIEIDGPNPPEATLITLTPNHEKGWKHIHLVESSGDLLMIFHYAYADVIVKFKVYKFDFNTKEWMIVGSLGDHTIYVDYSHSFSIPALDEFGCNSIFFVEDSMGWQWGLNQEYEWQCCGVYHMEDKTIETFSVNMRDLDGSFPPYTYPTWMIPSLGTSTLCLNESSSEAYTICQNLRPRTLFLIDFQYSKEPGSLRNHVDALHSYLEPVISFYLSA